MSLNGFFKDICKELENVENVSKKFADVKNDEERFFMAYEISRDYFSRLKLQCTCKNNEISTILRKEGNELFMKNSYLKALTLYNKSIAFALNESEELGFTYGNRASCLLRLNLPREALDDVEKALNLCTSKTFEDKLFSRKKQCLSSIKKIDSLEAIISFGSGDVPSLSRGRSSFFSSASNALNLSYDQYWERKLVVNDDVKVGEVLIVEKPFSSVLMPENFYTHCSKCFRRSFNLIPCSNCTTTMFCSDHCLTTANHSIECSYLKILSGLSADRKELLSLKILTDASNQGKHLEKLYSDVKEYKCDEGNFGSPFYESSDFINTYNLVTNSDKRTTADLFYRSVISAILILILENRTNFFDSSTEDRKNTLRVFCGGLILRFMQSLPCNAHEVSEYYCSSLLEIGAGAYATLSLINHSCDPNVVRFCCRDEIILRAIKPIKKGEQLFDNYGYHYATHEIQTRQNSLSEQYYFKCQCEPCMYDWPTFNSLSGKPLKTIGSIDMALYEKLTQQFEEDMQKVLDGDYSSAIIERNMSYLCVLHEMVQRPWINYNNCQELIKHCLNFHSNHLRPLNESKILFEEQ